MLQIVLVLLALHFSTGYENIALHKPTWQRNQFNSGDDRFDASNAVDGLKSNLSAMGGQCVISNGNQQTATWRVDLEDILSIRHIIIYYRTENTVWGPTNQYSGRFLGFSLYVSNTTDRTQGELCFHDTSYTNDTIPAVLNVTCPVHGQYVIYYNERKHGVTYPTGYSEYAFNELCEVEVYGCPVPGYYQPDCSTHCPDTNCRYCHIETGVCQGCTPGYQGHQCELPCSPQYYGESCRETCGNCSDGLTCNNVDGTCTNGCDVGVYGGKCKTLCPVGWYGRNCSLACTNCDTCDIFTGQCTSSCYPGWKGANCTDECDGRKYGTGCHRDCGACLYYKQCHHINGSCLQQCDSGYQGAFCKTECSPGKFGKNCEQNCSYNCDDDPILCNGTTGECTGGCRPGWEGLQCDLACSPQYYGELCKESCGNCSEGVTCNNVNGTCTNGCDVGVYGDKCKTPCPVGWHGKDCSLACTNCDTCDRFTGHCTSSCYAGWKGPHCTDECDRHKYGTGCNEDCGACLSYKECHHINGSCFDGCDSGYKGILCKTVCNFGYFGANCEKECSVFCQNSRDCHHVTGNCRDGCKSGWRGNDCLEVDSPQDAEGNWETRFYGVLGAFCATLLLNGVYVVYKFTNRNRTRLYKSQKYRSRNSAICTKETESRVDDVEKINNGYQELGELSPSSTYDYIH